MIPRFSGVSCDIQPAFIVRLARRRGALGSGRGIACFGSLGWPAWSFGVLGSRMGAACFTVSHSFFIGALRELEGALKVGDTPRRTLPARLHAGPSSRMILAQLLRLVNIAGAVVHPGDAGSALIEPRRIPVSRGCILGRTSGTEPTRSRGRPGTARDRTRRAGNGRRSTPRRPKGAPPLRLPHC